MFTANFKLPLLAGAVLLLLCTISNFSLNAQVPSYVPTDGLVGWWPFNGNANDESGNGRNGQVTDATLTTDRLGNNASAFNFNYVGYSNGSLDDMIYVPHDSGLNSSELSVSCWFKPLGWSFSGNPGMSVVFNRFENGYDNPHGEFWGISFNDEGMLRCSLIAESQQLYSLETTAGTLNLGNWYHVVLTYDGSIQKIYLNGILIDQFSSPNLLNTQGASGLSFGVSNQANGYWHPFNGDIDDSAVWNRALSDSEVQNLYNADDCSVAIDTIVGDLTPLTLQEETYNCTNTPSSTYQWEAEGGVITSGQGTSTVTVLWAEEGQGTLTVTETTEDDCDGSVSIEVDIVCATSATAIEGPLGPEELLEVSYTCDGIASSTYNWSISNGVITSGQGTNTVTVIWASTGLGNISVQETTAANCNGDELTVDVVVVLGTGVNEVIEKRINIFPNPASESITIDLDPKLVGSKYFVTNSQGKLVLDGVLNSPSSTLDVYVLSSGYYTLRLVGEASTHSRVILIDK